MRYIGRQKSHHPKRQNLSVPATLNAPSFQLDNPFRASAERGDLFGLGDNFFRVGAHHRRAPTARTETRLSPHTHCAYSRIHVHDLDSYPREYDHFLGESPRERVSWPCRGVLGCRHHPLDRRSHWNPHGGGFNTGTRPRAKLPRGSTARCRSLDVTVHPKPRSLPLASDAFAARASKRQIGDLFQLVHSSPT